MYAFDVKTDDKAELYRDLAAALDSLTADEPDRDRQHGERLGADLAVSPRPQLGRLLPQRERRAGARPVPGQGGMHPYPVRQGVCGAAATTRETQLVADVHAFPGHIACDADSRSELVVPIVVQGELIGVLDLDSPQSGTLRCRRRSRLRGADAYPRSQTGRLTRNGTPLSIGKSGAPACGV
jgi:L-methionine (R)-S-oxide reductase